MRRVQLGRTGMESSGLGFGCASLGSRVTAEEGLRALEAAFDGGVTWLDLAPAYGGGRPRRSPRRFLRGRRDRLRICTKVGLALGRERGRARGVMGAALCRWRAGRSARWPRCAASPAERRAPATASCR